MDIHFYKKIITYFAFYSISNHQSGLPWLGPREVGAARTSTAGALGHNSTWPAALAHSPPSSQQEIVRRSWAAPRPLRSLRANLTGVQAPLLHIPVHPLEVTEARGTAELCLPKVHVAGEEKVPVPWSHAALQQCPDVALPVPTALRSQLEDPAFLPVKPAHPQVDDGFLVLWCMGDVLDRAPDNKVTGTDGEEDLSVTARAAWGR